MKRSFTGTGRAAICLGILASGVLAGSWISAASADDYYDRLARSQEIQRNQAVGGPKVVGSNSPFLLRVHVCKSLPTKIRDRGTGLTRVEMRERCWFE
jgi:hypothetical protein